MKKQDQIEELKKTIVDMHTKYEELNLKLVRAKQDATAMRVRQIQGGSVPVGLLRNVLRADYEVVGQEESHHVFHLHLRHADPIEKALLDALLAPEKPKFATGGYTSVTVDSSFLARMNNQANHYFNGGRA